MRSINRDISRARLRRVFTRYADEIQRGSPTSAAAIRTASKDNLLLDRLHAILEEHLTTNN